MFVTSHSHDGHEWERRGEKGAALDSDAYDEMKFMNLLK